jgi:hypothetical protein
MKLVTKYQISAINSYWEKCDKKYLGRMEGRTDRRTEVKQYTPSPSGERGYNNSYIGTQPNFLCARTNLFFINDIWSQASYWYAILWVAFLDPSDSYFLFTDLVVFYTHWTYMHNFHHIFLSNYWWHKSDIWSQASYRYPISWEAFLTRQIPTSCLPT